MLLYRNALYIFSFLTLCVTGSCNLINPDEQIPAFIEVKHIVVAPDANLGSNSSKIKDVWVYADGSYVGTFELPAKFPVLLSGKHRLQFSAGVLQNGIAATRVAYPFYQGITDTLDLKEGETISLDTLTVNYFPTVTVFNDDFESGSSIDSLGTSLADVQLDQANAYEGAQCLKLHVGALDSVLECATNIYYPLPKGKEVYAEFNYKGDQKFYMGIISLFASGTYTTIILQVNPSETWNKMYVDMRAAIGNNSAAVGHKVYFLMKYDASATENNVYLDNLKLIYN